MPRYWVVGGEYTDTKFKSIAGGGRETRLGPFASYQAAKDAWQARAWATVDSANTRYRIVKDASSRKRAKSKPASRKPASRKPARPKK